MPGTRLSSGQLTQPQQRRAPKARWVRARGRRRRARVGGTQFSGSPDVLPSSLLNSQKPLLQAEVQITLTPVLSGPSWPHTQLCYPPGPLSTSPSGTGVLWRLALAPESLLSWLTRQKLGWAPGSVSEQGEPLGAPPALGPEHPRFRQEAGKAASARRASSSYDEEATAETPVNARQGGGRLCGGATQPREHRIARCL